MSITNYSSNINHSVRKYNALRENLLKEQDEILYQIELEENAQATLEQEIKNLIVHIKQLNEELYQIETNIEIEELKQKTCSDETQSSLHFLAENIDSTTELYRRKNMQYSDEYNISIKFIKETKTIKITFLNNDQEILIKMLAPTQLQASYELCVNELIEQGKKNEMDKLIGKFNARENPNIKEFIQMLRYLISN